MPIQCHWSLCVLEWSSCHLDQWRANAWIVHQLSKMDVHSGATLPQPNLTAKHQVSGLILWPVSEGDRWCQSSTNANHSIVTWMPLYCHSDNISTPLPLNYHLTATWLECQLTANPVSLNCHLSATGMLKTTNGMSLTLKYHSNVTQQPLKCHWNAHRLPIKCELKANWMPIDCQWYAN